MPNTPSAVPRRTARLGARTWLTIVTVGLTGQLAWTVENMYLNLFLYNTVTSDPTVLATLVAASALTATIATLLLGTASDRLRRRREFIAGGYVLWGASTAAFGLVGVDGIAEIVGVTSAVSITVLAIILLDCVMSFLGAGANDAAFTAWVTDVTTPANRGRVDGVLAIMPLLAMLLVFGALDGLTQSGQWPLFFGIVGGITVVVGIAAWFLVRDDPELRSRVRDTDRYLVRLFVLMRPAAIQAHRGLYTALLVWCVLGISTQVFLPYLIIYIQRYLKIDGYAIVLAAVLVTASVISVVGGRVIDRVGKLRALVPAVLLLAAGLVAMFFVRGMVPVILAGIVMMSGFMLSTAAISAIVRDRTPADRAGSVQGLRMIAVVLVPMVVGPFLGAAVITGAAETYIDLGQVKQVPTPWIFVAAAVVALIALVPVRMLRRLPSASFEAAAATEEPAR
ncbi:MFS transporter [Microbacterium abyssi]|uniref:MFS transporter n=1 Tax=Microbacterium abyssi TaxID=2782166 RepID=UPI001E3C83FA|nr:MFS transporter [Microbacterium sp. A18JL241]